jgi:hypothetical protein
MQIKKQIKNDVRKNGHAIFLKYSLKVNIPLSLPIVEKRAHTPPLLREKASTPTSNGLGRIMDLNFSLLLPPIRIGKSPTGT